MYRWKPLTAVSGAAFVFTAGLAPVFLVEARPSQGTVFWQGVFEALSVLTLIIFVGAVICHIIQFALHAHKFPGHGSAEARVVVDGAMSFHDWLDQDLARKYMSKKDQRMRYEQDMARMNAKG